MQWEAVIGLEIHAQLATQSKIFSGASTAFGAKPNTQACIIDLGLPGILPVLNEKVVRMAILFGVAVDAAIAKTSVFARKNYFYPDLPKGYQISQYELPIVGKGQITIEPEAGQPKVIGITRAHLEEDAGKLLHEEFHGCSSIDLNRAGTPLLEIVSEPDMRSAKEAVAYMKKIHQLVRYLDICDGNMQEGSFRCDANISVRPKGQDTLGTRAELKNLNSFRFVERAIDFEIERQIDRIEGGGSVIQETRLYDSVRNETRPMRSKEEANDYRYFPDPDLLPVELDAGFVAQVKSQMPELPSQKTIRFAQLYGLGEHDIRVLTQTRELADFFEMVVAGVKDAKLAANWVIGDLSGALHKHDTTLSDSPITASMLADLLIRITDKTISGKIAKQVFDAMWQGQGNADAIIAKQGLKQITDTTALEQLIDNILAKNTKQVEQYRGGQTKLMGFFVGQVMKATSGKANPQAVNELLGAKLK